MAESNHARPVDQADPQPTLAVDEQRSARGCRAVPHCASSRPVAIHAPAVVARIVTAETIVGSHPDHAVGGFGQRAHAQRLTCGHELRTAARCA